MDHIELFARGMCVRLCAGGHIAPEDVDGHKSLLEFAIKRAVENPPPRHGADGYDFEEAIRIGIDKFCKRDDVGLETWQVLANSMQADAEESDITQLARIIESAKAVAYSSEIKYLGKSLNVALQEAVNALSEENGLRLPQMAEYLIFQDAVMERCQPIVNNRERYVSSADMAVAIGAVVHEETVAFFMRTNKQRFDSAEDVQVFMNFDDNKQYFLESLDNGLEKPIGELVDAIYGEHYDVDTHNADTHMSDPLQAELQSQIFAVLYPWFVPKTIVASVEGEFTADANTQATALAHQIAAELTLRDTDEKGVMDKGQKTKLEDDLVRIYETGVFEEVVRNPADRERLIAQLKTAVQDSYVEFYDPAPDNWAATIKKPKEWGIDGI